MPCCLGFAFLAAAACLPLAAGLLAKAGASSKPLQDAGTSHAIEGQLGDVGRVNGSWHLCAAPVLATKSGPRAAIPRILHQTYKSKVLPDFFAKCHDSWIQETPKWKHRLWLDHENRALIKVHYPWFLETYDSYEHMIQRVDAARIFMLHRYGGVYADMDVEAVRDPSPLFNGGHELVFFYQLPPRDLAAVVDDSGGDSGKPRLGTVSNAMMASKPGHPFWMFLAEKMMNGKDTALKQAALSEVAHMDVYLTTGPSMLSSALSEYQRLHMDAKVAVFSKKYWSPFSWGQREDPCEVHWECRALYPEAFVISHWARSWIFCRGGAASSSRGKRYCTTTQSLLQLDARLEYGHAGGTVDGAGNADWVSWCP
mmetsp:Transcript_157547/g.482839  ORF Transcript_157547/g.482839 Transcript_157547/m.482839 type:complete len:369 (-) Transcript_157547:38-1144(-)